MRRTHKDSQGNEIMTQLLASQYRLYTHRVPEGAVVAFESADTAEPRAQSCLCTHPNIEWIIPQPMAEALHKALGELLSGKSPNMD